MPETESESEILVERVGAVTTITLHRPTALNALTPTMLVALDTAVGAAIDDVSQRVVVISGSGRAFSAGVDLKALGDRTLTNGVVGDILDVPPVPSPTSCRTDESSASPRSTASASPAHWRSRWHAI